MIQHVVVVDDLLFPLAVLVAPISVEEQIGVHERIDLTLLQRIQAAKRARARLQSVRVDAQQAHGDPPRFDRFVCVVLRSELRRG